MTSPILIAGWTTSDRVPGVVGETKFAQGATGGTSGCKVLLIGTKKPAAGTLVDDAAPTFCPSEGDAQTMVGQAGYELHLMAKAAFEIPGAMVYLASVTPGAGTAAGTATVTIAGSWADGVTGTATVYIGKTGYSFAFGSVLATQISDTADALVAAIAADANCPVTAAKGGGPGFVVTLTSKSANVRANKWGVRCLGQDKAGMPTGATITLGGAGVLTASGIQYLGGGASAAESYTTLIGNLQLAQYDRICFSNNTQTVVQAMEAHVNSEAGPLIGHLEHLVVGSNGDAADALAIAQTWLNAYRAQSLWSQYNRVPAFVWASEFAAYRSVIETDNPNPNYDGVVLSTASEQEPADVPLHSESVTALLNGYSPVTTINGEAVLQRAITTYSTDDRCLDTGNATVADRMRQEACALGAAYIASNPYAGPDPDPDDPPAPTGVGTPSGLQAQLTSLWRKRERDNWLQQVSDYPPLCAWDDTGNRIMAACPTISRKLQHQIGISVRQQAR